MKRLLPPLLLLVILSLVASGCGAKLPGAATGSGSGTPVATRSASATTATGKAGTPAVSTTPAASATTVMPVKLAGDYQSLVTGLTAAGAKVEEAGQTKGSIFQGNGRILKVNTAEVQAFEYASAEAAAAEVARISPDGSKVGNAAVDWVAAPHFFRQGRLMVVYIGTNAQLTSLLTSVVGPQVAGAPPGGAASSSPTAGASSGNCTDRARMTDDVTIPDNTRVSPGETFVKTWRLRNTGTCTWDTGYALVFAKGSRMGAPDAVPLTSKVAPGDSIDVSVSMTAPVTQGSVQGNWQLRNGAGRVFGIENSGDGTFFVLIRVSPPTTAQPTAKP